jgi:hypothetical protein
MVSHPQLLPMQGISLEFKKLDSSTWGGETVQGTHSNAFLERPEWF